MRSLSSGFPLKCYQLLIVGVFFGILNTTTINSAFLSAIIAIVEYIIVLRYLIKKDFLLSFIYTILFMTITVELDTFAFGDRTTVSRSSFLDAPVVGGYLYMLVLIYIYVQYYKIRFDSQVDKHNLALRKWVLLLFATGFLSAIIGYFLNDNGIQRGPYPKAIFNEMLNYGNRVLIILIAIELAQKHAKELSQYCISILICVVITSLITTFVFGLTGWYADFEIMLTSLAIGLTPFLICFRNDRIVGNFPVVAGIMVIIATFFTPTAIGSKWYLIISAAFIEFLVLNTKVKSIWAFALFVIIGLYVITTFAEPILGLMGNDYVEWKLAQAINVLSFSGNNSGNSWYEGLDHSTLYRVDELHNTLIEYLNKPWYAFFGKGFAGTTLHHTNILAWEFDSGAFPESQIKIGAYYGMHETFAVLFLRHGILGIIFMITIISKLVKRITYTPWCMVALVWFLFYWAYGLALVIGSIALVLAFNQISYQDNGKN